MAERSEESRRKQSESMRAYWASEEGRARHHGSVRTEHIDVTCPTCGKIFSVTQHAHEKGRGQYCSNVCKYRRTRSPSGLTTDEYRRAYYQKNRERILQKTRERQALNRDGVQEYRLLKKHGISRGDWMAMWDEQDGQCYLCGDEIAADPSNTYIEHDHTCCPMFESCRRCRRGLACRDCNASIGMAHDSPGRLRRMADALEAAQATVAENIRNQIDRGRDRKFGYATGDDHGQAKLTRAIVEEIRQRYANGETGRALAGEFGVSSRTISCAVNYRTWR